jgi:hypothetical protein
VFAGPRGGRGLRSRSTRRFRVREGDWEVPSRYIEDRRTRANHEITIMKKEDAEELLSFCEMLLKVIYEFPAAVQRRIDKP